MGKVLGVGRAWEWKVRGVGHRKFEGMRAVSLRDWVWAHGKVEGVCEKVGGYVGVERNRKVRGVGRG